MQIKKHLHNLATHEQHLENIRQLDETCKGFALHKQNNAPSHAARNSTETTGDKKKAIHKAETGALVDVRAL